MLDFRPGETPSWQLDLFEDDLEAVPLNCVGAALTIVDTDLGFLPAVTWRDRALGRATLSMTAEQTRTLTRRKRYWLRLRLELSGGDVTIPDDIAVLVR